MTKKKTKGATAAQQKQGAIRRTKPDPDADLETWQRTMMKTYLPIVGSEAERRHVNMHVQITHHLARELRAVRRAIEKRGGEARA